jgi:tetratricopeptide (TPR) repeat protein
MCIAPLYIVAYPLYLIDLPFSLAADTLLLPLTAHLQHKHGDLIDPPYFKMGMEEKDRDKKAEYYERGMLVLPKYYPSNKLSDINGAYYYDSSVEYLAEYYDDKKDYEKAFYYYQIVLEMDARDWHDRPYRSSKVLHVCTELGKIDFAKGASCVEKTNTLLQQKKH